MSVNDKIIGFCMKMINEEPRFIRELIRSYCRKYNTTDLEVFRDFYDSISYLIHNERLSYEIYLPKDFTGSLVWNPYKILYNVKYVDYNVVKKSKGELSVDELVKYDYTKRLIKKIKKVVRISEVGKKCAEMYENAVYTACKKLFKDVVKTNFNDGANPDVIIPSKKTLIEASARFENPIDYHYVWWKLTRWSGVYHDYKRIIFVSPVISKRALEVIKNPSVIGLDDYELYWIQYPETSKSREGFPIFRKYKYYVKYYRDVYRKVYLVRSSDMVDYLIRKFKSIIK